MWFARAAQQGHANAQNVMGLRAASGAGMPADNAEALRWFELAAAQAHSDAQNNLGLMYQSGDGVVQNLATAYMWFYLAASPAVAMAATEGAKNRDMVAGLLSEEMLAAAQARAVTCRMSQYMDCE